MSKMILATHNRDKIREIKEKVGSRIQLLTLDDYPNLPDVIEDGETLRENALKKAREIFEHTGIAALADDTGLEVDALNGAPGVYSSRYAGEKVSYADNVSKLLKELEGVPSEKRSARFRTVAAYIDGNHEITTEGTVEGHILNEARGKGGFGYDPVFYVKPFDQTFAEIPLAAKNSISHRGKAIKAILDRLILEKII